MRRRWKSLTVAAEEIVDRLEAKENNVPVRTVPVKGTFVSCRRSAESTLKVKPTTTGNKTPYTETFQKF